MKIRIIKTPKTQGSVIVISMLTAAIIGITLASYLILTEVHNVSIARSQSWNSTMALTEAGVEDGLQLVNRFAGSFEDLPKWVNYATESGWDVSGNVFHVKRYMPQLNAAGEVVTNNLEYYEAWVTNANNRPTIYAYGVGAWTHQFASGPQPIFAQVGGSPAVARPLERQVYVQTKLDPLFAVAMAAIETIDLKGNNISTDSFDSSDSNYSNNGLYPLGQINKTKDNGNVCTDLALINSLNVGNANIKGHVSTGPGKRTISIGPNGSVGDKAWVEGGSKGIKDGWSSTDFNVVFPDVILPDTTWLPLTPGPYLVDGTNYQYVIDKKGDYYVPTLTGSLLVKVLPTSSDPSPLVRLKINNSVILSGQNVIRLADTGARLVIFMAGPVFSMTGQAYIDNPSGRAERFYLFGLPTCTSIVFGGNANFYGGVYAPQAVFTLGGGGVDTWDFVGSSVTKSVTMNGHYNFHYDEDLSRNGPGRAYVPVSWKEK